MAAPLVAWGQVLPGPRGTTGAQEAGTSWAPGLSVGVLSAGCQASVAVTPAAYTRATRWLYWMVYIALAPVTTRPLEGK